MLPFTEESINVRYVAGKCTEGKSSPGFPLNVLARDNDNLLKNYEGIVVAAVLERLTALREFDCTQNLEPKILVQLGLCDAIRLFVKNEPHKVGKLEANRQRLIWSISLIDNTIARLCCSLQNVTEILNWSTISSKPGMGLNDEGCSRLTEYVKEMLREGTCDSSDLQGFDFSVKESDLLDDLERRLDLNGGRGTVWERVMRSHYYCMSRKVVTLSDGTMYQQLDYGIMPSGWYNTSGTNTFIRCKDHAYIAVKQEVKPVVMSMGDDALERTLENPVDEYRLLGKVLTDNTRVNLEDFEFCSTRFVNGLGRPVNVDKQLMNLLNSRPINYMECCKYFDQFSYEMRHHPQLEEFTSLVYESGWWKDL
jgi:hypothetical protein